ncbi:sensor histidine kinase [Paenibacillus sp. Marseille-Q4541]|uniref:ATP-binding protein n=1 Tax=Paenibacillus sp. Marseille-Q4541 TaxID=2831522 RepID=UPI001BA628F0|nr:sensor histidine kinase [Paenibacillus sp. Marseille-Q4541]
MLTRRNHARKGQPMKLRSKINLLVILNMLLVLLLLLSALSYLIIERKFDEASDHALFVARTVAALPETKEALENKNSAVIDPLANQMKEASGAEFVVVADTQLIRLSHPDPAKIGYTLKADDLPLDKLVLQGQEIETTSKGSLGLSVRGKTPVWGDKGTPIGLVSVGFLVSSIWQDILPVLIAMGLLGLLALFLGLGGAHLLSGHIKKQIYDMEPGEIAFLTEQQASILDSTKEGIIAINKEGSIITCNREAKKLMGTPDHVQLSGQKIQDTLPESRLMDVIHDGAIHRDEPMIIGNHLIITNRVPVVSGGHIIGAVATFRDKVELDRISKNLADIDQYIDALRSQRHEFMNQLHLISGLIKLREYDMVAEIIDEVNEEQQHLMDFFLSKIPDAAVVGVLIGKLHRTKEKGIMLMVDNGSSIPDPVPYRDLVITFLGNAIENALEAISSTTTTDTGIITVSFTDQQGGLIIEVQDNGPGIPPDLQDHIFEDGITTKGMGRGFGLALLERKMTDISGKLVVETSPAGTKLTAYLPYEGDESS